MEDCLLSSPSMIGLFTFDSAAQAHWHLCTNTHWSVIWLVTWSATGQSDCFEAFLRWLLESRPQHLLPLTSAPPLLTINRQCYCYSSILKLTFRKTQWRKVKQMPLHYCQQSIDKSTATSTKIKWRKAPPLLTINRQALLFLRSQCGQPCLRERL